MTVTVLVQVSIKDQEKFKQYGAVAGATIKAAGGEVVGRFRNSEVFAGDFSFATFVLINFPDAAAAKGWYASPEYQAMIPLRDEASDVVIVLGEPLG